MVALKPFTTPFGSQSRRSREKRAVNSINNRLRANLSPTEESAVESLDSILASLDLVKLKVDVTLSIRIEGNMDNLAVFLVAFGADVVFKLFDPGFTILPIMLLVRF